ncbi:MAG: SRPBCC domain-containing protein [Chitinophagales bacterium]|nr:SRPBCC domain-containing protein [Chitinophagales bacterium]
MSDNPIVIERVFNAPISKVWKAITDNNEIKKWYFPLEDFRPEAGFKFTFIGGKEGGTQYLHLCEITEVIKGKKLTYSWKYDGYPGQSYVSFELFDQGDKTLLKLTHTGVESFAAAGTDFEKQNFVEGWTYFVNKALKEYLEPASNHQA